MGKEVSSPPTARVLDRAAIGFAISAAMALLALGPAASRVGPLEVLLALSILVVSPLAVALIDLRGWSLRAATWRAQPLAAAFAIASLAVRRGGVSGLLALPWAALAIAVATLTLGEPRRGRSFRLETLLPLGGFVAQALAAVALVLWRARISPLAAGGPPAAAIAYLQFVGLGASVIASRLMRSDDRARALARAAAAGVLAGIPLDVAIATGATWLGGALAALGGATLILLASGSILWASALAASGARRIASVASTLVIVATAAVMIGGLADRFGVQGRLAVASWLRVGAFAAGTFVACDLLAFVMATRNDRDATAAFRT